MTDAGQGASDGRAGKGVRLALVLSLALNLAVAGLLAGVFLMRSEQHGPGHDGRHGRMSAELRELAPLPIIAALEPEHRERLAAVAREREDELRSSRDVLRARIDAMIALLRAEPFDADAMAGLLADQREAAAARQAVGETLLVEVFARMTPEDRVAYAERLDRSVRRSPSHRP